MKVEDIVKYSNPFLRKNAEQVDEIDENTRALIKDMFAIMEEAGGIGLAAPQVGVSKRVITISLNEKKFNRLALVNPVVAYSSNESEVMEEGCLSIPGVNADVSRPVRVVVKGTTRTGRVVEITAEHLLARVLQHEIDHLNGILFIDRVNDREKSRIQEDLQALQKQPAG
jgi:peptide deformylase